MTNFILHNATLHGAPADAVAIANGIITAVGPGVDLLRLATPDTHVIDCAGRVVIPGIVDDHCHLFATAARRRQVDCRPSATPDIPAVIAALRSAATTGDGWLRGYGYDDSPVGLGRHLNRRDLDAASTRRPTRVDHRSGHACVLNSAALAAVGVSRDTADPPGGSIVRDGNGEPTG
ncbi:MAG: amidohydrolase family protein, partial [Acidimicrobiia bacterium]|nr:amidohydrolase family protein [Acidimicrobiia bacterium]